MARDGYESTKLVRAQRTWVSLHHASVPAGSSGARSAAACDSMTRPADRRGPPRASSSLGPQPGSAPADRVAARGEQGPLQLPGGDAGAQVARAIAHSVGAATRPAATGKIRGLRRGSSRARRDGDSTARRARADPPSAHAGCGRGSRRRPPRVRPSPARLVALHLGPRDGDRGQARHGQRRHDAATPRRQGAPPARRQ